MPISSIAGKPSKSNTLLERTPESCLTWDDDFRLVPGSLNRAIKDYIEQHAKPPVRVYLHPINEKYAGEAGSIPVILRHGVLRNEVWFSLPDAKPTETLPDKPQRQPEQQEAAIIPQDDKLQPAIIETKRKHAQDVLKSLPKPRRLQRVKPRIMKQKPNNETPKRGRGRPRGADGTGSRSTLWRQKKRAQSAVNNLSVNGMIAQAKEVGKQIKEDIKKKEKGERKG